MKLEQEFVKTVGDYKGTIYTVCYMFSKNSEEIDDLYQEVLINLWQGWEKFRGESKLSTWIYRVSLNTCLQIDRRKRRRPASVPLSVDMNLFEDTDEDTRQNAQLYRRINRLRRFERAKIQLWLEGMSYEEIGEIVGITVANVSVRLVRIREQLKKMSNI